MAKSKAKTRRIVLDTNVILFEAQSIFKFQDCEIHIPISVIEEIDRFKRDIGENGRNARQFSRFIDVLRAEGSLAKGVKLEKSNSLLYISVDINLVDALEGYDEDKADNRILGTAIHLQKAFPESVVELITKDINLRIKADVFGVKARDYEPDSVSVEELYAVFVEISVNPGLIITQISDCIKIYVRN